MHEGSRRAVAAAFLANLGIAVAKLAGFLVTGASALLAEAIHSLADTGNQGLLVRGGRAAARPADAEHSFGHGRDRYFWAFVVALVLFLVGGLFAVYEGVAKLRHPHAIDSPAVALAILAVAAALEGLSLRTALREARPQRAGRSWVAFVRAAKRPELPVVLLEDLAALCGLALALAGVIASVASGRGWPDGAATLAIGLLLVTVAAVLALEMRSLLIGEAALPEERLRILREIEGTPDVRGVIHLRTLHLGPDELLVAAKVELDRGLTVPGVAAAIDAAEARVRSAVPTARAIYLEPDLRRAGPARADDPTVERAATMRESPIDAEAASGQNRPMPTPTPERVVTDTDVRAAILRVVRRAGQPVIEAVLHQRVTELVGTDVPPERFLALTEDLVTDGYLRVDVDRDPTRRRPAGPFEPRYYRTLG